MGHLIPSVVAIFFSSLAVSSGFELYSKGLDQVDEISKFKCVQEGRFSHPKTCGSYIECVRSKKGTFKRRFGNCHGSIFNETLKHCVQDEEELHCKRSSRVAREIKSDSMLNSLCNTIQYGFVCADCKTTVNCVEGVAYIDACGAGEMCAEKSEFNGAVCYPNQPESCTCTKEQTFRIDHYNPKMFFYCNTVGDEPDLYQCPDGRIFDEGIGQCTNGLGLPECQTKGHFALQSDCSRYYTCIEHKHGWMQKPFTCNDSFMFNEFTSQCEDPCTWNSGMFTCQKEGRFPDPLSCAHYYECVQQDQSFRQYRRQCPSGTEWDEEARGGVGHCVKKVVSTCSPVVVNKCKIPDGWCAVETGTEEVEVATTVSPEQVIEIKQLREEKQSLENEKELVNRHLSALSDTRSVLGKLKSAMRGVFDNNIRSDEIHPIHSFPNGVILIFPYCSNDSNGTILNTPNVALNTMLSDVSTALQQDSEYLQCLNTVLNNFIAFLSRHRRVTILFQMHERSVINLNSEVDILIGTLQNTIKFQEEKIGTINSKLAQLEG